MGAEVFGYQPARGQTQVDLAQAHRIILAAITIAAMADAGPPGRAADPAKLPIQPQSPGLSDRICWGSTTRATARSVEAEVGS